MKKNHGKVTLKMIAQCTGTSIGTVDRALNNRKGISEESKKIILQAAEEMGYKPNQFASALARKKTYRIGISYPYEHREFYKYIDYGVTKAAEELIDYGIIVEKIRYEIQDPVIACQRLSKIDPAEYDGFAFNVAGDDVSKIIDDFTNKGIPVITFNTDALQSSRKFFVGNNSRQSGLMAGELLGMLMHGKGNVTVLGNFARSNPFLERFSGFCESIRTEYPGITVYPCLECFSVEDVAFQTLVRQLEQMPNLGGIFCTGFTSTLGAVNALKKLGRKDIFLVGYDVTAQSAQALREGWCSALIHQDPVKQGYLAAHMLANHVQRGWVPTKQWHYVDTHIVIKNNLDNYLTHNELNYIKKEPF